MTKYTCFDVSVKDHIAHVVMNRPDEFNTMTTEIVFAEDSKKDVRDLDP